MEEIKKMEELQLKGKVIISGVIKIETGIAIGGSTTSLDIGGMDNPVIKDAKGFPYIPGSSLKGKLRSLLEQTLYPLRYEDKGDDGGYFDKNMVIHKFKDPDKVDEIMKIFGSPDVDQPVRGIFRDAFLDISHFEENREILFKNLELEFTEDKIENSIDRISARANPRHLERVPPGSRFAFEIILDLFCEEDKELLKTLMQGLKLLEDDYLGGSGTRGSGKILLEKVSMIFRSIKYYTTEKAQAVLIENFTLKDIEQEDWFPNVIGKINF
jgi:CRISPR-associated protein Csm3